ncbi:MAG: hypothetical protein WC759_05070 [Candidatus Micrarchaeia archaeon]|jgi:hypothetical protein
MGDSIRVRQEVDQSMPNPMPNQALAAVKDKKTESVVLLRVHDKEEPAIFSLQFAIQKGDKFLDANRKEIKLAEGTYAKCYNWYKEPNYADGKRFNPYNPMLEWSDEKTVGGRIRVEYLDLLLGTKLEKGESRVIYGVVEDGKMVRVGVGIENRSTIYDVNGKAVKGNIYRLYMGAVEGLGDAVMSGEFDPKSKDWNWQPPLGGFTTGVMQASYAKPAAGGFVEAPDTKKYAQAPVTVGGKLKAQYEKGITDGTINAAGNFYVFRSWDKGSDGKMKVEETGLAYKDTDGNYHRVSDSTKLKDGNFDVLLVKKGSDALAGIKNGTLEPKAGRGENGWQEIGKPAGAARIPIEGFLEQYSQEHRIIWDRGEFTAYVTVNSKDPAFWKNGKFQEQKYIDATENNGSGIYNGNKVRIIGGKITTVDEIHTSRGTEPDIRTSAVSDKFRGKGKFVVSINTNTGEILAPNGIEITKALDAGGAIKGGDNDRWIGEKAGDYSLAFDIGKTPCITVGFNSEEDAKDFVLKYRKARGQ